MGEDVRVSPAYREYAKKIVGGWPPLSDAAQAQLRGLLGTGKVQPNCGPIAYGTRPVIVKKVVERVALYRHFDTDGVLLYVGISNNPSTRSQSHHRHSAWTDFVAREEVEWLPDRDTASAAERDAIKAERPLFNGVHATDEAVRAGVEYLIKRGRTDLLRFGGNR
jgi:predicted GIY-YIG superfamily endonuclease